MFLWDLDSSFTPFTPEVGMMYSNLDLHCVDVFRSRGSNGVLRT